MRLSQQAKRTIRETVEEVFGPDTLVTLFGSRVDDTARGGDIDLLVQSRRTIQRRERKALQLAAKLQVRLGDQPIDVLLLDPQTDRKPIHEQAIRTGVRL